jgi:hypothetical protein
MMANSTSTTSLALPGYQHVVTLGEGHPKFHSHGREKLYPTAARTEVAREALREREGGREGGRDYYLDAVLDGDAGERVHPGNFVLQAVVAGRRRGRGRRPLRREHGAVVVGERVSDAHGGEIWADLDGEMVASPVEKGRLLRGRGGR